MADNTNAASACSRFFNTPELLDLVFEYLSPPSVEEYRHSSHTYAHSRGYALRRLFSLHRVNKTFYHHIFGNSPVAKELFLSPTYNLQKRSCLLETGNNIAEHVTGSFRMAFGHRSSNLGSTITYFSLNRSTLQRLERTSWTRLLISKPPIYKIWARPSFTFPHCVHVRGQYLEKAVLVPCVDGMTLGDVVKIAEKVVDQYQDCEICGAQWSVDLWARISDKGEFVEGCENENYS